MPGQPTNVGIRRLCTGMTALFAEANALDPNPYSVTSMSMMDWEPIWVPRISAGSFRRVLL